MEQDEIRDFVRAAKEVLNVGNGPLAKIMGIKHPNYLGKSISQSPTRDIKLQELLRLVNYLKSKKLLHRCPPLPTTTQSDGTAIVEVSRVEDDGDRGYSRDHYEARIAGAIPELDVTVGAGEGGVGDFVQININGETSVGHKVIAEWLFPDGYLQNTMKVSHRKSIVMEVRGDSMDPTVRHGDKVIIDLRIDTFGDDGLYLISDGQSAPRLKRLEYIWKSDPPTVKIISDNPAHREIQTMTLEEVKIVGRVAGRVLAL